MTTKRKILTVVLAILSLLALVFVSRAKGQDQSKNLSSGYNCSVGNGGANYNFQSCKVYDPETGKHYIVVNSYYGVAIARAD